jgi:hypothetical protein
MQRFVMYSSSTAGRRFGRDVKRVWDIPVGNPQGKKSLFRPSHSRKDNDMMDPGQKGCVHSLWTRSYDPFSWRRERTMGFYKNRQFINQSSTYRVSRKMLPRGVSQTAYVHVQLTLPFWRCYKYEDICAYRKRNKRTVKSYKQQH